MKTAAERIATVLEEGGPRKPNVLRGLLKNDRVFERAIAELRAKKRIRIVRRNGGPHYALVKK